MSSQAMESGPPSQISDAVSAAGVLDLAIQIAGRPLVGRHVSQRRRSRRSRDRGVGHVNVCPPQFVLPGTPRSARYVRSNHPVRRHRLQQVRALERLSIEIGCGLSFDEAATFCRPSAPADTICRPSHRPTPPSVVGFDVRQRWRWRGAAVQHLVAGPPDHSDVWLPARPAASGV